jgi:hypothetical protein
MTGHQYEILRALSKGPRTLRSFTHSPTVEQTRVSPFVIELNMGKLVAAGYVLQIGPHFAITNAGKAEIDLGTPQPKLPIALGPWKPKPWNPPREGSGRMYDSFGEGC